MKIIFQGASFVRIEDRNYQLLIDPYFEPLKLFDFIYKIKYGYSLCSFDIKEIYTPLYIFITHGHFDHYGQVEKIIRTIENKSEIKIIANSRIVKYLGKKYNIEGYIAYDRNYINIDNFSVQPIISHHRSDFIIKRLNKLKDILNLGFPYGGHFGYLIKFKDLTLYHNGDGKILPDEALTCDIIFCGIDNIRTLTKNVAITTIDKINKITKKEVKIYQIHQYFLSKRNYKIINQYLATIPDNKVTLYFPFPEEVIAVGDTQLLDAK